MNNDLKYSLYLDIVFITGNTTYSNIDLISKIRGKNGTLLDVPESDFFLTIPLYKQSRIEEYVDVQKQDGIQTIERQNFNPFFIEYSFFDSVTRNKIFNGDQLNSLQINYIRSVRPDISSTTDIKTWFNNIGYSQLPWFPGTIQEVTVDMIDIIGKTNLSIVSKANLYPIEINS